MFDIFKNRVVLIAAGLVLALALALFAALASVNSLEEKVTMKEQELARANAWAAANAQAALGLQAEVDRLAAQASQAARLRSELSSFRTTLLERIDNAEPSDVPVPPVIADTFGELHDRFETGSARSQRDGAGPG